MQKNDASLLFPPSAIATLRSLRGSSWQKLVDLIISQEPLASDRLAFILMMVRLGGCATCQADSFRAMRGCAQCSTQTIKRFRGDDRDLLARYNESKIDITKYIKEDLNVNE
jgi:hypothetical protein